MLVHHTFTLTGFILLYDAYFNYLEFELLAPVASFTWLIFFLKFEVVKITREEQVPVIHELKSSFSQFYIKYSYIRLYRKGDDFPPACVCVLEHAVY